MTLTLVYRPETEAEDHVTLFTFLPLCIEETTESESVEEILNAHTMDFGFESKEMLKSALVEIEK